MPIFLSDWDEVLMKKSPMPHVSATFSFLHPLQSSFTIV